MMRKIFLLPCLLLALGLNAQNVDPQEVYIETDENVKLEMLTPQDTEQETKEQKKEREKRIKQHENAVAYAKAANSMQRGYFVLLAENVQLGNLGYRHYDITSNTNFILIQDEDGIVQFALNNGFPGSNGLGGWTGKGRVRNKQIKQLDNGDVYFQCQIVGGRVNADVSITLFHNSNRAIARISNGVPITINGEIKPYRDKDHR